jgi:cell division septation protein DedD
MADEAFHEIQMKGKQLVFLFMLATVAAVVIFLCGVMVGRGVRTQRAAELAELTSESTSDLTAGAQVAPTPSAEAAPAGQEKLTYPQRLEAPTAPAETLKESQPTDSRTAMDQPAATAATPAATAFPASLRGPQPPPAAAEPGGDGFAVQVAAIRGRGEADAMVRRLKNKGYPAYVMTPARGAPSLYRVRVGKFKDRRAAEVTASRLQREEQFKPWITR